MKLEFGRQYPASIPKEGYIHLLTEEGVASLPYECLSLSGVHPVQTPDFRRARLCVGIDPETGVRMGRLLNFI